MFFMNGNRNEIVNANACERFCISEKEDAALVIASYGRDRAPLTLGRYRTPTEAKEALDCLLAAFEDGKTGYSMMESTGAQLPMEWQRDPYHGVKQKRRGGS